MHSMAYSHTPHLIEIPSQEEIQNMLGKKRKNGNCDDQELRPIHFDIFFTKWSKNLTALCAWGSFKALRSLMIPTVLLSYAASLEASFAHSIAFWIPVRPPNCAAA